jgi:hypothetical protein
MTILKVLVHIFGLLFVHETLGFMELRRIMSSRARAIVPIRRSPLTSRWSLKSKCNENNETNQIRKPRSLTEDSIMTRNAAFLASLRLESRAVVDLVLKVNLTR